MPLGLFLPIILALWLLIKKDQKNLIGWGLTRIWALALLFGIIVLSYFDLPIGEVYLNLGGAATLLSGCWFWFKLSWSHRWRVLVLAVIVAILVFFGQNGLLWQLEQFFPYIEAVVILVSILILTLSGDYRDSLISAAIGIESAGLVALIITGSGMGLSYLNLVFLTSGGAWLLLWCIKNFRRKQLTNADE